MVTLPWLKPKWCFPVKLLGKSSPSDKFTDIGETKTKITYEEIRRVEKRHVAECQSQIFVPCRTLVCADVTHFGNLV